ncbi:MAG TPA: carboxypeptidase regulatory-like domain-containing protein, partial [Vicinamibacteria bacterium]|nr:carboxypeptidase regulatory-like domain-containing protein [Vicinamibacteria bacterium]
AADGSFDLTGAPPGPVNLRATSGDSGTTRSATAQIVVADGEADAQAQIVFESGFTLSGTVTRNSQPVDGATVSASLGGSGRLASARTSSSGAYRLEGLSEGTYSVMVSPPPGGGGTPHFQSTDLSGDATLDLVIPFARLGGTVVDGGTRQPLADASVQAAAPDGGRVPRGATTDSNGHFALEDLDATACTLTVRHDGFQLDTRQVTPAEGGSDDLVVELTRGVGIGIEVHDATYGVPLRAVQVRATNGGAVPAFVGLASLDADGRGEVPSLPPGSYVLAFYANGYAPSIVGATAPAPRILVAMTAGGAIEIRSGPATLAHGNVGAQVLASGGQPYPFSLVAPDGRLTLAASVRRIENLGPGSYVLQVDGGAARPFDVQVGGLTVVTLP